MPISLNYVIGIIENEINGLSRTGWSRGMKEMTQLRLPKQSELDIYVGYKTDSDVDY